MSLPQLINTLTWWQWLAMAAIPPAIVLLYFLKLKRYPLEVPSTFLWHKSIEDLRVNSIWQRLRRNLLLLLQLLVIFLAMLAVLRPGWRGSKLTGERFIFLVDNSASMQATDTGTSRLDEAKRQVRDLIQQMKRGDAAMIVSFADTARVEAMFTRQKQTLLRGLDGINETVRQTTLSEALKVAGGLANPGSVAFEKSDTPVAAALPATLYIFSDGRFEDVSGFAPGNLEPIYTPVGLVDAHNVAIVAFSVRRSERDKSRRSAFARIENFGPEETRIQLDLHANGDQIDADRLTLAPGEAKGIAFELGEVVEGALTLTATTDDDLKIDDVAHAVVNPPRPAQVLLITSGNEPLELGLSTDAVLELAEITIVDPEFLKTEEYVKRSAIGAYDLVVYDRCSPKEMPQANTFFVGSLPPGDRFTHKEVEPMAQVIDVDGAHPLMQWINFGNVQFVDVRPLTVPDAGSVLLDTNVGPLLAIAPRESFEDAVTGFVLIGEETDDAGKTRQMFGTNWPLRPSFPVFAYNLILYLGGGQGQGLEGSIQPGDPIELETPGEDARLSIRSPDGKTVKLPASRTGKITFTATGTLGVHEVLAGNQVVERFAVNLFSPGESNIKPQPTVEIGHETLEVATTDWTVTRRELWKWLLGCGLVLLSVEWYLFSRRIRL